MSWLIYFDVVLHVICMCFFVFFQLGEKRKEEKLLEAPSLVAQCNTYTLHTATTHIFLKQFKMTNITTIK